MVLGCNEYELIFFFLRGRSGTAPGVLLDLFGGAYLYFLSGSEGGGSFLFRALLLCCAVWVCMYVRHS